jgi:hypothetical protein
MSRSLLCRITRLLTSTPQARNQSVRGIENFRRSLGACQPDGQPSGGKRLVGTTGNTLVDNGSTGNGGDCVLLLRTNNNKVMGAEIFGNKGSGIKVDILSTGNIINNEVSQLH